jgi:uncharacterized protein (TIGR02391 family)
MPRPIRKCPECGVKYPPQMAHVTPYFNLCPMCGELFSKSKRTIMSYLRLTGAHEEKELEPTLKLAEKGELTAAARQALVTLEDHVRRLSGLSHLTGRSLMSKAFSFDWDMANHRVTRPPLVTINDLKSESQRNEQDGILHISIGLMAGARNILAHHSGRVTIGNALNVLTTVTFVLHHISSTRTRLSDVR